MVDDRPDDATEPGRAKRAPPTLDLSATEIPREEMATESAAHPNADGGTPEPKRGRGGGIVAAALSGAAAGALVVGLAWFAGSPWLSPASDPQQATPVNANAVRIDDLTARLTKLESRPAPQAPAAPDLSAITGRLDALDKSAAGLRDETTALRAQSSQALNAAADAQKDVKAVPRPPAPDLSGITGRLAQLEATAKSQGDRIAEQARKPIDEIATRRIATAALLDARVRAGEPYGGPLAAAKTMAADATKLAPLDAYASAGVPSANTLARELLEVPRFAPPPSSGTAGGLIARLKAGAGKLVTIERTDAPNADNAAFARAADAAKRDDIASAARELAELPSNERAAVQPWLDKVAARNAALSAARQFADEALAAMPKQATP